jgi:hypothetical protein
MKRIAIEIGQEELVIVSTLILVAAAPLMVGPEPAELLKSTTDVIMSMRNRGIRPIVMEPSIMLDGTKVWWR